MMYPQQCAYQFEASVVVHSDVTARDKSIALTYSGLHLGMQLCDYASFFNCQQLSLYEKGFKHINTLRKGYI